MDHEVADGVDGRSGELFGLLPPEEGLGLAGAAEGQAKLGVGIHPVMDGIAMDAGGFCGLGDGGAGGYQRQHVFLRRGRGGNGYMNAPAYRGARERGGV